MDILIVTENTKNINEFNRIICANTPCETFVATSLDKAEKMLFEHDFAIAVVVAPVLGDNCARFILDITERETIEVIVIADEKTQAVLSPIVEPHGVFIIGKPLSVNLFQTVLRLAVAARKKVVRLNDDNIQLLKKLDDIKVVNRAKCCLIQYLGMSESDAHKFIEKRAMDGRTSKRIIAEDILKTYEY